MKRFVDTLASEPRARWFLLATVQSSIGTGAATVALLVIAYDRLHSPWAITLILLAEWLPSMVAGPVFGAIADRWSRRACAVVADLLSAGAFIALAFVHSFAVTAVLALIAGAGISLWFPAILAALPSLASQDRRAVVTSLFGAARDAGRTLGPLLAAAAFPLVGAETVMVINGATFALSAVAMALIPFGSRDAGATDGAPLLAQAREGLVETWRMPGVRVILWASTAVIFTAAMINVGELLLSRDIGASASGFALLMTVAGGGVIAGSLLGAREADLHTMKRRYVMAAFLIGVSILGAAASYDYLAALLAFLAMGVGNGLLVVHERLIFQAAVPERLMGRAFAVLDMLTGWGYAGAFILAGAIVAAIGTRTMFAVAGTGATLVALLTAVALRRVWPAPRRTAVAQEQEQERAAPLDRDPVSGARD